MAEESRPVVANSSREAEERLNSLLAAVGAGSTREVEELLRAGPFRKIESKEIVAAVRPEVGLEAVNTIAVLLRLQPLERAERSALLTAAMDAVLPLAGIRRAANYHYLSTLHAPHFKQPTSAVGNVFGPAELAAAERALKSLAWMIHNFRTQYGTGAVNKAFRDSKLSRVASPSWFDALMRRRREELRERTNQRYARIYPALSNAFHFSRDSMVVLKLGEAYPPLRKAIVELEPDVEKLFLDGYRGLFLVALEEEALPMPELRHLFATICEKGDLNIVERFVELKSSKEIYNKTTIKNATHGAYRGGKLAIVRWLEDHFEPALMANFHIVYFSTRAAARNDLEMLQYIKTTFDPQLAPKDYRNLLLAIYEGAPFRTAAEEEKSIQTTKWLLSAYPASKKIFNRPPDYVRLLREAGKKGGLRLIEFLAGEFPQIMTRQPPELVSELHPRVLLWWIEKFRASSLDGRGLSYRNEAFKEACKEGDLDIVESLFRLLEISPERLGEPFYLACARGHVDVASWLLEKGPIELSWQKFEKMLTMDPSIEEAMWRSIACERSALEQDAAGRMLVEGARWLRQRMPRLMPPLSPAVFSTNLEAHRPNVIGFICTELSFDRQRAQEDVRRFLSVSPPNPALKMFGPPGSSDLSKALREAIICLGMTGADLSEEQLINVAFFALYGDVDFIDWAIERLGLRREHFSRPEIIANIPLATFDYRLWFRLKFGEPLPKASNA